MAEPSFLDPYPFANFPQFDASDLSFDDPNLFPDGGEGITADFDLDDIDLDDIDLDFSVDELLLPSADDNSNGSSSNSNSNITANSNSISGSNPGSPESGNSSGASGAAASHQDVKQEENNSRLKRKIDDNGIVENPSPSPDSDPSRRNLKIQRSDEGNSPWSVAAGTEEDEKRRARLMRNRESAQLSRQRKKQYVEELEEKVKLMNSTIADLNGKISFYMTENARLHQQLSGNGANGKGNPPPPPQYYFPLIPYGGYPMRHNGPPVPYVPIPRLKPRQPVSAPKVKKTERKKSESKTKKVASVSLLGLFFVMMVFGGSRNFGLGGNKNKVYDGFGGSRGRVLTVKDRGNSLNDTQEFGQFSGKMGCGGRGRQNSSESLPALLYVPRNGKHVEINGNLIIHSVLASERAMEQTRSRGQEKQLSVKEGTGLMIPGHVASALAIPEGAMGLGTHSRAYRNSAEYPRALGSGSHDAYRDNIKSTLADGPLQQWFREGLAGNDDIYCSSYLLVSLILF